MVASVKCGHTDVYLHPNGSLRCRECRRKNRKDVQGFYSWRSKTCRYGHLKVDGKCSECKADWRLRNLDKKNEDERNRLRHLRMEVLLAYGPWCRCCGEWHYELLTLDHKNNDGAQHRKELNIKGSAIYRWAKKNDYPNTLQVLCYNCNCSKGFYGYCPHQEEVILKINATNINR